MCECTLRSSFWFVPVAVLQLLFPSVQFCISPSNTLNPWGPKMDLVLYQASANHRARRAFHGDGMPLCCGGALLCPPPQLIRNEGMIVTWSGWGKRRREWVCTTQAVCFDASQPNFWAEMSRRPMVWLNGKNVSSSELKGVSNINRHCVSEWTRGERSKKVQA